MLQNIFDIKTSVSKILHRSVRVHQTINIDHHGGNYFSLITISNKTTSH